MNFKSTGFSKSLQKSEPDSANARQNFLRESLQNLCNIMIEAHRASGVDRMTFPGYGKFALGVQLILGSRILKEPNAVEAVWAPLHDDSALSALVARVEIGTGNGNGHFRLTYSGYEATYCRLEDVKTALVARLQHSYSGLVFSERDSGMVWAHPFPAAVVSGPAASDA